MILVYRNRVIRSMNQSYHPECDIIPYFNIHIYKDKLIQPDRLLCVHSKLQSGKVV